MNKDFLSQKQIQQLSNANENTKNNNLVLNKPIYDTDFLSLKQRQQLGINNFTNSPKIGYRYIDPDQIAKSIVQCTLI
jgi:hypothetical protein